MTRGLSRAISFCNQGEQALISAALGVLWMRRPLRESLAYLKCLTALVT